MSRIDLFGSEKKVIEEARHVFESGLIRDEYSAEQYRALLMKYTKLYK
ncbi:MAG: hypothetical protein JRG68_08620 [Deltaproteobacteria bacterium]|nr:hypothetical protein [Deltaproteobacteria bacterium]